MIFKSIILRKFGTDAEKNVFDGSYHWMCERLVTVALLGILPTNLFLDTPQKSLDYSLALIIPLHSHFGFSSIITDYLPSRKLPKANILAKALLTITTIGSVYGLFLLNKNDVGLSRSVKTIWTAKANPSGTV
jgi:succinate dehydrogenase (ubiquinone) membrane anchor subunit